jgi:hypothetical protein
VGRHAGSGDHSGKPEFSENRVSEGYPGGALGDNRYKWIWLLRVSGLLRNPYPNTPLLRLQPMRRPQFGDRVISIRRETYAAIRGICNYTLV